MLWKASATLGTLLLLSGVSHFSSRVGAEAAKLFETPKNTDSFQAFNLPWHEKRIQTANVAYWFVISMEKALNFPRPTVRPHSAYWMIWQEWPPRCEGSLKILKACERNVEI